MKILASALAAALLGTTSVSAQTIITTSTVAAGGITAGDTAGYPATISQSGSFKLGSNLTPPSTAGGIAITGSNVLIDLNGFTIDGGVSCSPNASYGVTCLGSGSSQTLISITGRNVTIRNGFIRGSRNIGVNIALAGTGAAGIVLEDVVVSESFSAGIYATSDGVSLINTKSAGPELIDLQLVGIYQDMRSSANSVAVLREKQSGKRHKLRTGDQIGRLRVAQIRNKDVVFTVEDFGFERQETLSLRKQEDLTQ